MFRVDGERQECVKNEKEISASRAEVSVEASVPDYGNNIANV